MSLDPTATDPDKYRVLFENDRVRVLGYTDTPGGRTSPHQHPDSVMVTLSSFRRRLHHDGGARDVEIPAGIATWLPAQQHSGENIGDTETHTIFVELKEPAPAGPTATPSVGPDLG
jgi:beta-alanine degradation protein BauB